MDKLKIIGNSEMAGSINIPGAKNSSLPIMISSLLTTKKLHLSNLPNLNDIQVLKKLLKSFNVKIIEKKNFVVFDSSKARNRIADYDLVRKMRASILVLGPLLARFKEAKISLPGGCAIGNRPIDIHLLGLEKLGVSFTLENGFVSGKVKNNLKGNSIILPFASVGATENILMAAVLAEGKTEIINAAREPEILDLAENLNKMGAKIKGAGTNKINIDGVKALSESEHHIIADRIVAGTYIIAAIMTNKEFVVKKINPNYLKSLILTLKKMGAKLKIGNDFIQILPSNFLQGCNIETNPYPGFPTDLQAQMMSLMSIVKGNSKIKEKIFENRFMHVSELNRLGAQIKVKNDTAYITGNRRFKGAQVMASDLRASVSLVLAGICAEGQTVINRVYHIDRGYEKIEKTLGKFGPNIRRVK